MTDAILEPGDYIPVHDLGLHDIKFLVSLLKDRDIKISPTCLRLLQKKQGIRPPKYLYLRHSLSLILGAHPPILLALYSHPRDFSHFSRMKSREVSANPFLLEFVEPNPWEVDCELQ